jgi:branched-chain amino acid transport system permease protein
LIDYVISLLTLTLITAIIVTGLNVRWGWAGEFDLSYYAFVAIGAYTTAVLVGPPSGGPNPLVNPPAGWILGLHWPFIPSVIIAMLVTGALSAVLGSVALRKLRGDYFAITTIAFTLIVTIVFSQNFQLFNGFLGVFNIPQPFYDFLHQPDFFTYNLVFIGICAFFLAIVYVVLEWLLTSPFGLTLRAIREDEQAAAAYGRNVYRAKLKAFVIGGMVAGLGGSLYAVYLSAWNPSTWSPVEGFLLFAGIFLGGQGNIRGVILGVFIVTILIPEGTRWLPEFQARPDLYPALRNIVSGFLILAVLRWRPQGILPERHLRDAPSTTWGGFRIPRLPAIRGGRG